jgi:phospholipase C
VLASSVRFGYDRSMPLTATTRDRVDHIVVVMMENRSFDHMLGYLGLPEWRLGDPGDASSMVDGVDDQRTVSWEGVDYTPLPLGSSTWEPPEHGDPPHGGSSVAWQVEEPGRFIETYINTHEHADPRRIIGYLTPAEVPVYDFLAREYCVCDRWHCSVPGATWPNRMFAVAGTAGGETDIPETVLEGLWGKETFFRDLDRLGVSWRWYSSDPSLLRAFDKKYRVDDSLDRFAFFDEYTERQRRNFLTDAASGSLPSVSWVDPNFFKLPLVDGPLEANDDHPPHDVRLGQKFINVVYEALRTSPNWDRSLMIITYDEHGGFYDHAEVPPPLGPRVPTILVSPWLKPGQPCHERLEHTSIIKTVLARFGDEEAVKRMGPRVYFANDIWHMLTETTPRPGAPVADPGAAALSASDLTPRRLRWPAATLQRTIQVLDEREAELTGLQYELLLLYEQLRRAAPRTVARSFSRFARRLPTFVTRVGRFVTRPFTKRLPAGAQPMPERMP